MQDCPEAHARRAGLLAASKALAARTARLRAQNEALREAFTALRAARQSAEQIITTPPRIGPTELQAIGGPQEREAPLSTSALRELLDVPAGGAAAVFDGEGKWVLRQDG